MRRTDMSKLSASEAIYGFAGWLTTREKVTQMGANYDCNIIADLVNAFCDTNNLVEPRDNWTDNLTHPD